MWQALKTIVEVIAEMPNEKRSVGQAMPETHYLVPEQDLTETVKIFSLRQPESRREEVIENKRDTLILPISLQNL